MKLQSLISGMGNGIAYISAIVNFFVAYFYHGVSEARRNRGNLATKGVSTHGLAVFAVLCRVGLPALFAR